MTTYIKIDFIEPNSANYWYLPETIGEYPKCKGILLEYNINNNFNEVKELIKKYNKSTFEGTPMLKLGTACYDLDMATRTGKFTTDEAADNFLKGKLLSIASSLIKTKKYLQNI